MLPALQKLIIKLINASGGPLQRIGLPRIPLEEQALLNEACWQTGLYDFGDDSFREPLRVLLQAYAVEARLNLIGRLSAWHDTLRLLRNRLRLAADRQRYPAIAEERIHAPIFILGLPRTGSTLLHNLLAQDPANRVPRTWEVMDPSPPPDRHRAEDDPRIAQTQKLLNRFYWITPEFKVIHPMEAQRPIECVAIMSHTFSSPQFQSTYHVPSYQKWLEYDDQRTAYAFHRMFLQHLQWRSPAERWILKAPPHIFALDTLLTIYPDARFIQTHRDPLRVIASVASLDSVLRRTFSDHVDLTGIGLEAVTQWSRGAHLAMEFRDKFPASDRILDVHYADLIRDPVATVRGIYAHFGLDFTNSVRDRMTRFLSRHPKDQHGIHRYSLAQFGLTPEAVRAQFRAYSTRFGITPEAT